MQVTADLLGWKMISIKRELVISLVAWLLGMVGIFLVFNGYEMIGKIIVFLFVPVGGYFVIKGQIKFFGSSGKFVGKP